MNIFITTRVNHTVFSNGLLQNIIHLQRLFTQLGHDVFFVAPLQELNAFVPNKQFEVPIMSTEEIYFNNLKIDYLIHAAWDIPPQQLAELKKRKGSLKVISLHYGNAMFSDLLSFNTRHNCPLSHEGIDAVWTSPHFENSTPYLKAYYNTDNVFVAPYIWGPEFLEEQEATLNKSNKSAHYDPRRPPVPIIIEPNITPYKCALIPLLIYKMGRLRYNIEARELVIACANHLSDFCFFKKISSTNLGSQLAREVTPKGRVNIVDALASQVTHIISHQMYVGLNYAYLDAAYFKVPLIHNSPFLQDFGYYYPEFDCLQGAHQLKLAEQSHNANLEGYAEQSANLLEKYSYKNALNQEGYETLLNKS